MNRLAPRIGRPDKPDGDVRRTLGGCAFVPVVVHKPGIEAIMEGIRLANVQGFELPRPYGPTQDIDP